MFLNTFKGKKKVVVIVIFFLHFLQIKWGATPAIDLTGEWVVGLCKIRYPHTWYSLRYPVAHITMQKIQRDMLKVLEPAKKIIFAHYDAFYSTVEELVQDISPGVKAIGSDVTLTFNRVSRTVQFQGSAPYAIRTSAPLCYMLVMKPDTWMTLSRREAPYPADRNEGSI